MVCLAQWPTPTTRLTGETTEDWKARQALMKERWPKKGGMGTPLDMHMQMAAHWPTPTANPDNKSPEAHLAMKQRMGERDGSFSNRVAITDLQVMIKANWPTPRANNEAATLTGTDRAGWDLPTKMTTSNWPTPTVADVEGGRKTRSGARGDEMLLNGLMSAPRVTPSARDWKDSVGMATSSGDRSRMDQLPRQMAHSGPTTNGSPAQTEKRGASRGSPNPYFAAWLMGWPEWLISGAHTAILKHKAR